MSCSTPQAQCLADRPTKVAELQFPNKLPGELYDADIQCKWQFGRHAQLCTYDFGKVSLFLKHLKFINHTMFVFFCLLYLHDYIIGYPFKTNFRWIIHVKTFANQSDLVYVLCISYF